MPSLDFSMSKRATHNPRFGRTCGEKLQRWTQQPGLQEAHPVRVLAIELVSQRGLSVLAELGRQYLDGVLYASMSTAGKLDKQRRAAHLEPAEDVHCSQTMLRVLLLVLLPLLQSHECRYCSW